MKLKAIHTLQRSKLTIIALRKAAFSLACVLAASWVFGQSEATFEAITDKRQVTLDDYFEVTFLLKNASASQFVPPTFKDFVVVAGPNVISSINISNGVTIREIGHGYTLQPTKVGKFTVGSASVKANGKAMRTSPLSIEVVKSAPKPKTGGQQFFIRIVPSKKQAYIGEQITLDFKLYTKVGIEMFEIPEDPDYDGFYAVDLRRYSSTAVQEVIDGQQYITKVMRRIALFPQQTGKLTVDPFRIQLGVVEDDGSNRSIFSFNRSVKQAFFTTDAVVIDVKPLPGEEPEAFCGAVGTYELQAGIDRKAATTDEAISMKLVLTGNGDIKRVKPPMIALSDSFEIYEPKVVGEKSDEIRGEIVSEKTFEYLILPKYPGQYTLKPTMDYFNIESGRYTSFSIGPFPLSVNAGTGKQTASRTKTGGLEGMGDILPIKSTAKLAKQTKPLFMSVWFYLLLLLPVLGFAWLLFYQKKQKESANIDPMQLKVRSAGREAQKRLGIAQQQLQIGNSRAFYDEVSRACIGYVCDKTGLPLSQLTKDTVREKLSTLHISPARVDDLVKVIETCEVALFAGMDNPAAMSTTYENAIRAITMIEGELNQNRG